MARRFEFEAKVGDGPEAVAVGYSSKRRGKYLAVVFPGPDGKRQERMTQARRKDATFHDEVAAVLARVYAPVAPTRATWEEALDKVGRTAPDLRPDTVVAYRKAVRVLRATLDGDGLPTAAPADITPAVATRFGRVWLGGTYRRGKAADAKEYRRKPITLAFYHRQLSALWVQFLDLGLARENPWRHVRRPQVDKVRKHVPTEGEVDAFFAWVRGRYPQWDRLHALLELKAVSGCRSLDLCGLRTVQVAAGRVTWTADQTKQREGRAVLLPADLYERLVRLAGPTHLWEHFPEDLRRFRPSRNRRPAAFRPKTVYWVLGNVFREYNDAHPDRPPLSPHALRRRAITLVAAATQSVDATAQAIGLNPATARRYYLDSQRAFDTDEVFRKVAGVLSPRREPGGRPHNSPANPEQSGPAANSGEQRTE